MKSSVKWIPFSSFNLFSNSEEDYTLQENIVNIVPPSFIEEINISNKRCSYKLCCKLIILKLKVPFEEYSDVYSNNTILINGKNICYKVIGVLSMCDFVNVEEFKCYQEE